MRAVRDRITHETGRLVGLGAMFGAWPRHTGAGRKLLAAMRAELDASGTVMVAVARDATLANWYVNETHATRLDEARPLMVAWLPTGVRLPRDRRPA